MNFVSLFTLAVVMVVSFSVSAQEHDPVTVSPFYFYVAPEGHAFVNDVRSMRGGQLTHKKTQGSCAVYNRHLEQWTDVSCHDQQNFCESYQTVQRNGEWKQVANPNCDQSIKVGPGFYGNPNHRHYGSDYQARRRDQSVNHRRHVSPRDREITRPIVFPTERQPDKPTPRVER